MADDIDEMDELAEVLVSAHAPAVVDDVRLNIAAPDADFRKMSLEVIVDYIARAARYPNVKQINMHFAPKRWSDAAQTVGREGTYDLLVDGIRQVAAFCERHDLELVLENLNSYWSDDIKETPYGEVDWSNRNQYFAWRRRSGSRLSSTSTAPTSASASTRATSSPTRTASQKSGVRSASWPSSRALSSSATSTGTTTTCTTPGGRDDSHAPLDRGSLPTEMHRRIKYLDATLLLEHFYDVEVLEEELAFIDSL